jgi:hypothetical protein
MGAAVRHHPRAGLVTVKGYPTDWLTSALGQTEKNSVRAYVFRFALKLGHCSMHSARLKGAPSRTMELEFWLLRTYQTFQLVKAPVAQL